MSVKDLTYPATIQDDPRVSTEGAETVVQTGNLATPRRTVLGVLAHIARLGLSADAQRSFLLECGLPPVALDQPDVPITLGQELACMGRILERLDPRSSIHSHAVDIGLDSKVTNFGMLGLTMMYADSTLECARVIVSYPELCWGHSRIAFVHRPDALYQSFEVGPIVDLVGVEAARPIREYCVTVDLTASVRIYADVFGPAHTPTEVWLPYPAPHDHRRLVRRFECPVKFDAPQARLYFRTQTLSAKPLLANPLAFRAYERLTAQLAGLLRADVTLAEQVRRLLWMTAPPPDRDTVASMLAMSSRTLARKLAGEGTSYAQLQRDVRRSRAHEYLRSKDLHVSEVANLLGFADATAFSRAFRAWEGQSPSAWRRNLP